MSAHRQSFYETKLYCIIYYSEFPLTAVKSSGENTARSSS